MFIGLIFDILLLIFVVISCLLIYSLLLISVETKAFEIGVMRLVGLTKAAFVALIMAQASMFVLPSLILGYVLSIPSIWLLYSLLFDSDDLSTTPSIVPSWQSTFLAVAIGLLMPTLSAIVPIRAALSKSLSESLST